MNKGNAFIRNSTDRSMLLVFYKLNSGGLKQRR
jgi:hypothetical protein